MNNYKGKIVTTLFRKDTDIDSIDSFEQELLELLDVGYSVIGFSMSATFVSALLIKAPALESTSPKEDEKQ